MSKGILWDTAYMSIKGSIFVCIIQVEKVLEFLYLAGCEGGFLLCGCILQGEAKNHNNCVQNGLGLSSSVFLFMLSIHSLDSDC